MRVIFTAPALKPLAANPGNSHPASAGDHEQGEQHGEEGHGRRRCPCLFSWPALEQAREKRQERRAHRRRAQRPAQETDQRQCRREQVRRLARPEKGGGRDVAPEAGDAGRQRGQGAAGVRHQVLMAVLLGFLLVGPENIVAACDADAVVGAQGGPSGDLPVIEQQPSLLAPDHGRQFLPGQQPDLEARG
jgi:hypothetical protein